VGPGKGCVVAQVERLAYVVDDAAQVVDVRRLVRWIADILRQVEVSFHTDKNYIKKAFFRDLKILNRLY